MKWKDVKTHITLIFATEKSFAAAVHRVQTEMNSLVAHQVLWNYTYRIGVTKVDSMLIEVKLRPGGPIYSQIWEWGKMSVENLNKPNDNLDAYDRAMGIL